MSWENIADIIDLSKPSSQKLKAGQVLTFNFEGSRHSYRIMRIRNGKLWVKRIYTVTGAEMMAHNGHSLDTTPETIEKYGVPFCWTCEVRVGKEIQPENYT